MIETICHRYAVPLRVAALQFGLGHPAVTSLIVGAQSPQETQSNLEAFAWSVPTDLWLELKASGFLAENVPVPG